MSLKKIIQAHLVRNNLSLKLWWSFTESAELKYTIDYSNKLVIRQKGESQTGCFKKTKHAKFFEKRTFLTL